MINGSVDASDFHLYKFHDRQFNPNESFEGVRTSSSPEQIKACFIDWTGDPQVEAFIKKRKQFHVNKMKWITEREEEIKKLPYADFLPVMGGVKE